MMQKLVVKRSDGIMQTYWFGKHKRKQRFTNAQWKAEQERRRLKQQAQISKLVSAKMKEIDKNTIANQKFLTKVENQPLVTPIASVPKGLPPKINYQKLGKNVPDYMKDTSNMAIQPDGTLKEIPKEKRVWEIARKKKKR